MMEINQKTSRHYLLAIISGERKGLFSSLLLFFLSFLAKIYYLYMRGREMLYLKGFLKRKKLPSRVICVGNITTGGTGKTPLVKRLAEDLSSMGKRVLIISGGYASQGRWAQVVTDGKEIQISREAAGDELYLLASELEGIPMVKGKDRYKAGLLGIKLFSPDLILLDDGFQHLSLERDLDLLLIDALNPFGFNHLLPRGLLREPLRALHRAGGIIISRSHQVSKEDRQALEERLKSLHPNTPLFFGSHQPLYLRPLFQTDERLPLDSIEGQEVITLCGIGNPQAFIQTVEELGASIIHSIIVPDHYPYPLKRQEAIRKEIEKRGAPWLLLTQKDGIKLKDSPVFSKSLTFKPVVLFVDFSVSPLPSLLELVIHGGEDEC